MTLKSQPQMVGGVPATLALQPKTPANSSVTGINMTSIKPQAPELTDADTRNAITYALQKLQSTKHEGVSLLNRQQNFGLFTLILHLTLKRSLVTTVSLQAEAGVNRKTVARYVDLLLKEDLVAVSHINNSAGKGRLLCYRIHPVAIEEILDMRRKSV